MGLELYVIYGLIEQKDAGVYLCRIFEFFIQLHNECLDTECAKVINKGGSSTGY